MQKEPVDKSLEEKKIQFDDIVTCSKDVLLTLELAKEISQSELTVLLSGETGTGKEVLARAIHNNSSKSDGPFIVVNCAGIQDTLLESELFGHEKGSFTDASSMKRGKFELANGGTLFLDEVGDMSMVAQPKTLRAIEEKRFYRVGGEQLIDVNCRIIVATNKDLSEEIKNGRFREDLYYRLNEAHMTLLPLRQRKEDIPLLIDSFIKEFNKKFNKNVEGVSDVVRSYLMKHDWPGNIRELRSVMKIGMALIQREVMWMEDLPFKVELAKGKEEAFSEDDFSLDAVERKHILRVLSHAQWNKVKAAQLLKISRPTLDRKIKTYNLESEFPSKT